MSQLLSITRNCFSILISENELDLELQILSMSIDITKMGWVRN